jgi:transposase
VAVVALRTPGLRRVEPDGELVALRLLSDRRTELVQTRTRTVNRLHRLLSDLVPAGAPRSLTAQSAKTLLATIRPRDVAGRTRRALAADLIDDVAAIDRKVKALDRQLTAAVAATGTTLTDIVGIGPVTAAVILGEVGDIRRFPSKHHFATYTGTAPLEVSSGEVVRHRLSRAGNRQLNRALHVAALTNKRLDPRGAAYHARKLAEGKGRKGATRCLKRRLADAVYHRLVDDLNRQAAGPGGHSGATQNSSATGPTPAASSSEKSLPGPATHQATPHLVAAP